MILVFDVSGNQIGIMQVREALHLADQRKLSLFLTGMNEKMLIGKLSDRHSLKEEQAQRNRNNRKKQGLPYICEVKFRLNIDEQDYQSKLNVLKSALESGAWIKLLCILRGREVQFKDSALTLMQRFIDDADRLAKVRRIPLMEGKSLIALLESSSENQEETPVAYE